LRLAQDRDGAEAGETESEQNEFGGAGPRHAIAEAVLLGNLPGMAGPWLTQYAQLLAQQDGAVAVLHVDADAIDLELVEPTSIHPRQAGPNAGQTSTRVPPRPSRGADLIETLDRLITSRHAPVRTVLVRLDPTPESIERLLAIECWTLLSGADDAAVVAGYRMLKKLLDSDRAVAGARVGLMVVGSDETTGRNAARRLRSAAASFLHAPIELIGFQQRMIPARCRTIGRFEGLSALWPRLAGWLRSLEAPPSQPDNTEESQSAQHTGASKPGLPPLDEPVHVEPEANDSFDATSADSTQQIPTGEVDLLSLIDTAASPSAAVPGGIALEARCPSQPHTQLALDAAGRLHLLHRHDAADGDPPTPREAIVELVAVRDWARQHRQLLQLTERARRFDPDADPTLHLFTDRADQSVHLVARLGELLKLHLLRDVTVGDQHTLFCVPLSA
jgi:hypothetical protein